mmetsp:Transcript_28804/g.41262  ORF Transcript_28804/g.41262 Transcript_28804/m.41262 type:complete len:139 (-) Transcript_28804:526-942(-)
MRVVLMCGGARRANLRIQALDFLPVLLRLTWDGHGSLSRIRVPIFAALTEVMERTVATAAACHYREQRKLGKLVKHLSNDAAEASLCPLWRTLDQLHHQSASDEKTLSCIHCSSLTSCCRQNEGKHRGHQKRKHPDAK